MLPYLLVMLENANLQCKGLKKLRVIASIDRGFLKRILPPSLPSKLGSVQDEFSMDAKSSVNEIPVGYRCLNLKMKQSKV
jgi:hypothetical protein